MSMSSKSTVELVSFVFLRCCFDFVLSLFSETTLPHCVLMHVTVLNLLIVTDVTVRMSGNFVIAVISVLQANDDCKVAIIWKSGVSWCDKPGYVVFARVFSP